MKGSMLKEEHKKAIMETLEDLEKDDKYSKRVTYNVKNGFGVFYLFVRVRGGDNFRLYIDLWVKFHEKYITEEIITHSVDIEALAQSTNFEINISTSRGPVNPLLNPFRKIYEDTEQKLKEILAL